MFFDSLCVPPFVSEIKRKRKSEKELKNDGCNGAHPWKQWVCGGDAKLYQRKSPASTYNH